VLLGSWALVLIPVAISLLRKRATHQLSPLDKQYLVFCSRLAGVGIEREPGEAPSQLSHRAQQAMPALSSPIDRITTLYTDLAYREKEGPSERESDLLRQFTAAVRGFRPGRRQGWRPADAGTGVRR
jgi:hypothetical protein